MFSFIKIKGTDCSWGTGRNFCSSVPVQVLHTPGTEILHLREVWEGSGKCCLWSVLERSGTSLLKDFTWLLQVLPGSWPKMAQSSLCSYSPSVLKCGSGASELEGFIAKSFWMWSWISLFLTVICFCISTKLDGSLSFPVLVFFHIFIFLLAVTSLFFSCCLLKVLFLEMLQPDHIIQFRCH